MFCGSVIFYLGLHSFTLEVIGASLCAYNCKLLFVFFCSQKEALERARILEKSFHIRSTEENSPASSISFLVRMTAEKLRVKLMHLCLGSVDTPPP